MADVVVGHKEVAVCAYCSHTIGLCQSGKASRLHDGGVRLEKV